MKKFRARNFTSPTMPPAKRRIEPGERGIDAPLTVMDCFVLHELPREHGKGEGGSVPIDRCVDISGVQCGEQVSLLFVERGQEFLPSQRAGIVFVLSRPIHSFCRQRGVVDTADTDDVPQLLTKRRKAVANPMWCPCRPDCPGGSGVKFHLSSGTARTKSAVKL
jgi:hypothetical protein